MTNYVTPYEMLKELHDHVEANRLNDTDIDFLEPLFRKGLDLGLVVELTEEQLSTLNDIYARYVLG